MALLSLPILLSPTEEWRIWRMQDVLSSFQMSALSLVREKWLMLKTCKKSWLRSRSQTILSRTEPRSWSPATTTSGSVAWTTNAAARWTLSGSQQSLEVCARTTVKLSWVWPIFTVLKLNTSTCWLDSRATTARCWWRTDGGQIWAKQRPRS